METKRNKKGKKKRKNRENKIYKYRMEVRNVEQTK